jgi:diguanylate cyclase
VLITFSAGVALRHPQENLAELTRRADAAMYQAKQSGKNKVMCADA